MEETIGQFGQWREKAFDGCQGLCKDATHLRFNTIHTHRWLPKPPSSLIFRSKSHMGDQEFSDPASVRHNEDWASPDGQEELRREGGTWYQRHWCQGCSQTREVIRRAGEGLHVEKKKEEDPTAVKESLEIMEKFYKQMALVENRGEQNHNQAVVEEVLSGKCPDARSKMESSKPGAHKRKRRGGKGSRLRRLLIHQLLLTERRGLPLSRLLRTEAKSQRQGRREQEESASPILRRRRPELSGEEGKGKNGEREGVKDLREEVEERREEVRCCSRGALTGDINLSTPRSTKTEATTPSPQVFPQIPGTPPFPHLTPPPTPSTLPVSPPYTLPFTTPYTLPLTPAFTPPYSQPHTPLFTPMYTSLPVYTTPPYTPPPCGPMPGLQWLFCGGCQAWGTVTLNT